MRPTDLKECWRRFKVCRDPKSRDALIRYYAYLVKITAGRVISNLPPSLERDDLVSAGVLGLIKAVDQFDPSRQVKFETYAIALIRGAILEMLREDDWVPRSVRDRLKQLERTTVKLESTLGRPATEPEIAEALGIDVDDLHRLYMETGRTSLVSLEATVIGTDGSDKLTRVDVIEDDTAMPSLEAELHERRRLLGVAIDRLPDRERLVIALYYYEGMTFKEIGKILTVSESRVYQLHTQAAMRLKGYLQPDTELFRC